MNLIEAVRTHRIMDVPRSLPNGTSPIHGHGRGTDGWKDEHGEQFIRAFDAAFGLTPITEFPYLLKYGGF